MTDADQLKTPEPVVLKGDEAIALWREGREAWNAWIEGHPGARIDFNKFHFPAGQILFAGYQFGDGEVSFADAIFGNRDVKPGDKIVSFDGAMFGAGTVSFNGANFLNIPVSFKGCTFGKGEVSFVDAKFDIGAISFDGAIFGDGKMSFKLATFGDGDVSFKGSTFGKGEVCFADTIFGNGAVSFEDTTFGDGKVSFYCATFGVGALSFKGANFGDGDVIFSEANLSKDSVVFSCATFGDGTVSFSDIKFGEGLVNFSNVTFGSGDMSFRDATCAEMNFAPKAIGSGNFSASRMKVDGPAIFELPPSAIALKQFDLRGATFDGPLTLSGNLNTPPDLRSVKAAHHVELSGLTVSLRRGVSVLPRWLSKLHRVAEDKEDAPRLRRLKEIAETNRDHRAALRFSADENRARRWHETPWIASVLDMGFSFLSDYGQSIMRPTAGLFAVMAGCFALYWRLSDVKTTDWWQAALLSLGNSLPFLPQSRTLRIEASEALFCAGPDLLVYIAMVAQGTASVVLLFLIGLGLRNRFRL